MAKRRFPKPSNPARAALEALTATLPAEHAERVRADVAFLDAADATARLGWILARNVEMTEQIRLLLCEQITADERAAFEELLAQHVQLTAQIARDGAGHCLEGLQ